MKNAILYILIVVLGGAIIWMYLEKDKSDQNIKAFIDQSKARTIKELAKDSLNDIAMEQLRFEIDSLSNFNTLKIDSLNKEFRKVSYKERRLEKDINRINSIVTLPEL